MESRRRIDLDGNEAVALYIKSIVAGVAAFVVAVIISGIIALAIMFRWPELAMRIFPAQTFDLQYGASYSQYFPLWQILGVGLVAFVVVVTRLVRRESSRM